MTTLEAALREACLMELENIPSEEELSTDETLTFSPAFEKKMRKLIRRADHPIRYRAVRAAACVLLAALLSGGAVLAFVPEVKASFSRWIKEVYETHIIYRYAGEGNNLTASEGYRPTWIPNGYEESYTSSSEYDFTVVYTNDIGQNLTFSYSTDMSGSAWFIENAMTATKQAYVNEMPADILIADNIETCNAIVWVDSENTAFYISAFLDEADLIRMAESVHKKYFPEVLSRYEITELPEGFTESERTEFPRMTSITYENESGDVIFLNYSFMAQGGGIVFDTEDSDVFDIEVNHMNGQFFESKTPGNFNTITWIDTDQNIQFDLSGTFSYDDILRMAESVHKKYLPVVLPRYEITELPEGFAETSRVQVDRIILCTYTGSNGSTLYFSYSPMSDGIIEAVTTNGIEPEAIVINGMTGDFYLSNDASETNELIWFDQNANIAFSLSSYFDKAVMMRMAESVSLAKTNNKNPQLDEIEFDYLPDGMSEIGREYSPQTHYQAIWFEDATGRRFEISQDIMTSNKQSTMLLDTEDAETTKIDFHGYDAALITKGEQTMLLCVDDDSCVLLSSDFPPEEIIKIANGVNILNK